MRFDVHNGVICDTKPNMGSDNEYAKLLGKLLYSLATQCPLWLDKQSPVTRTPVTNIASYLVDSNSSPLTDDEKKAVIKGLQERCLRATESKGVTESKAFSKAYKRITWRKTDIKLIGSLVIEFNTSWTTNEFTSLLERLIKQEPRWFKDEDGEFMPRKSLYGVLKKLKDYFLYKNYPT